MIFVIGIKFTLQSKKLRQMQPRAQSFSVTTEKHGSMPYSNCGNMIFQTIAFQQTSCSDGARAISQSSTSLQLQLTPYQKQSKWKSRISPIAWTSDQELMIAVIDYKTYTIITRIMHVFSCHFTQQSRSLQHLAFYAVY